MPELSIMCDESGEWGEMSEYYLVTLVFHDQSADLDPYLTRYQAHLKDSGLPKWVWKCLPHTVRMPVFLLTRYPFASWRMVGSESECMAMNMRSLLLGWFEMYGLLCSCLSPCDVVACDMAEQVCALNASDYA